jgi:hypothetical protein
MVNISQTIKIYHQFLFKKGDKINANDEIGIVFTNESTGKTVLKFNIFNELKPENPTIWLDKY